jgi:hypothetical protein
VSNIDVHSDETKAADKIESRFVCSILSDAEQTHNVLVSFDLFPIILTTATWFKLAKNVFRLGVFLLDGVKAEVFNEFVVSHIDFDEIDFLALFDCAGGVVLLVAFCNFEGWGSNSVFKDQLDHRKTTRSTLPLDFLQNKVLDFDIVVNHEVLQIFFHGPEESNVSVGICFILSWGVVSCKELCPFQ